MGKGLTFHNAGSDFYYAAGMLSKLSGTPEPLVWAKRLAYRYVETRDPKTGLGGYQFSQCQSAWCDDVGKIRGDRAQYQYGDDFKGHRVVEGTLFPCYGDTPEVEPQVGRLLLGEQLGDAGRDFTRWVVEELTAWGKSAYRKKDNTFIPMLTDGTSMEGYVCKKDGYFGPKGRVLRAGHPGPAHLWLYAWAFRQSRDAFLWEMARNIAQGNGWGDIGETPQTRTGAAIPEQPGRSVPDHRVAGIAPCRRERRLSGAGPGHRAEHPEAARATRLVRAQPAAPVLPVGQQRSAGSAAPGGGAAGKAGSGPGLHRRCAVLPCRIRRADDPQLRYRYHLQKNSAIVRSTMRLNRSGRVRMVAWATLLTSWTVMEAAGAGPLRVHPTNPRYFTDFERRDLVVAAGEMGFYVSIMLFDSWSVEHRGTWKGHPFHASNNVNGINGDPDNNGVGIETHTLKIPAVTKLQEAYARKVVDTVNDLDNVLYEISNESEYGADWHNHFARVIQEYETEETQASPGGDHRRRPHQRRALPWPADWISPNEVDRSAGERRTKGCHYRHGPHRTRQTAPGCGGVSCEGTILS